MAVNSRQTSVRAILLILCAWIGWESAVAVQKQSGGRSVEESVHFATISEGGTILATGEENGGVQLRDIRTGEDLGRWACHQRPVQVIAFGPGSRLVASAARDDPVIKVWSPGTGEEQVRGAHPGACALAFAPQGALLASGGTDQTVRLWDLRTGRLQDTLTGQRANVFALSFSPDGNSLASGAADGSVRLWDTAPAKLRVALAANPSAVQTLAFTPDSRLLAIGRQNGTVQFCEVRAGRLEEAFMVGNGGVTALAFSSDGRTLALGGADATVRLWDLSAQREVATLKGHQKAVSGIAFCAGRSVPGLGRLGWKSKSLADRRGHGGTCTPIGRFVGALRPFAERAQ